MGVMQTALSALSAADFMLSVAANNLANLNTSGFKSQSVSFADAFYQTLRASTAPISNVGGSNPLQIGTGVFVSAIATRMAQGTFTPTGMSTDLAILGNGFFAVQKGDQVRFTRDGSFRLDAQGHLVHIGSGSILLGWVADSAGNINTQTTPVPIVLPTGSLSARATTLTRFEGNLDSRKNVGDAVSLSFTVFDSLGNPHIVQLTFTKAGVNAWNWQAQLNGNPIGNGTVNFDGNGQVVSGQTGTITLTLTNGATSPQAINLDFGSIRQLASETTVGATFQDGFPPGDLESFSVDAQGVITASFTNGVTRPVAQIAIAMFTNPEGLERVGDNLFNVSGNSGLPRFLPAGIGGAGRVQGGGLEMSNVDLARELTQVLIAQRSFQAAARTILAADELIQEALNLRR